MIFEKQIISAYKKMAYNRCDDSGTAFYFSYKDFDGLKMEEYPFSASSGHKLQGFLYSYDGFDTKRLIVFDHGFGGGHRSYMKEIEKLCSRGYLVLAYDHTGCMESGGEGCNGMAQSLCDLNDCISAVKKDPRFSECDISVMGHSWGGFSTLNIAALHPEISHIVVLSGFVSVPLLIKSYFGGILSIYRKKIIAVEREANPKFSRYDAIESLRDSNVKALLIYSDNDKLCKKNVSYDLLIGGLENNKNIKFRLEHNKGHNPNYTEDAVNYLAYYIREKTRLMKKNSLFTDQEKSSFLSSFDWNRMTMQDESVWEEIFSSLEA